MQLSGTREAPCKLGSGNGIAGVHSAFDLLTIENWFHSLHRRRSAFFFYFLFFLFLLFSLIHPTFPSSNFCDLHCVERVTSGKENQHCLVFPLSFALSQSPLLFVVVVVVVVVVVCSVQKGRSRIYKNYHPTSSCRS